MNPRLTKELRPLRLAWCVAAMGAAGHFVALTDPSFAIGQFGSFLAGLAGVALVAGCLLLSALPMGWELQERTLSLFLSQPMERSRLWKEKLLAATIAVVTLSLIHGVARVVTGQLRFGDALLYTAFMVAAICSIGFWTLATRSIIAGIMTAVSIPIWIAFGVHAIVWYGLGLKPEWDEQTFHVVAICASYVYSTFFLWLGQRQFAKLEIKDASASGIAQIPEALVPKKLSLLFRCQPTGALANLIRKEVRLQKPVYLISAIFAICWLVALLLLVLEPSHQYIYVGTLNALTGIQITLTVVLTGCVALAEEKSLGLAAWHLTLPVSARRQWLVKLLVSAATAVLVGLVLPLFLACLTLVKAKVGLAALAIGEIWGVFWVLTAMWVVGVLGFWCATFWENTVRAALATVLAVIGIGACAQLAAWVSVTYSRDGLQTNLITSLIAHFRLPPDFFANHEAVVPCSVALVVLAVMLVALLQSLAQFRRAQVQGHVMLKYSLILAAVAFAGSFWCADLAKSIHGGQWALELEFQRASLSFWEKKGGAAVTDAYTVTSGELEQSGKLSENAKLWLKDSHVTFTPVPSSNSRKSPHLQVLLVFPDGKQYWFGSTQRQPKKKP